MERKLIFTGALSVLLLVTGAAFLINFDSDRPHENLEIEDENTSEIKRTSDGTKYTVNPEELRQGCPSMDCIPSIDNPTFESAEEADEWLESDDKIIGVEIDGESKAYPLRILNVHEIVNDELSGEPIVVTYCPLCRSGVTYSRTLNNETLEFGVSGKLLNANLVMYDRGTESYWNQIQGEAIVGPRVPQKLDLKFSSVTEWSDWKKGHPETQVLSRNTGIYSPARYDSNPYAGYDERESVGFGVREVDDRLPSKEIVFGVDTAGGAKAYPEDIIESEQIIQDTVGGEPVVILKRPDDGAVTAYKRESGGQTLDLTMEENGLRDSSGELWGFDGKKQEEDLEMEKIESHGFFWFAWSKFRPETEVYQQ